MTIGQHFIISWVWQTVLALTAAPVLPLPPQEFLSMCIHQLSRGKIETMFQVSMVAHHLIIYAQECIQGKLQGSNYSFRTVDLKQ